MSSANFYHASWSKIVKKGYGGRPDETIDLIFKLNGHHIITLPDGSRYEGNYEEPFEGLDRDDVNDEDDLDIIFQLSSYDQSRDEVCEPNYINYDKEASEVDSMVTAVSEDEISLYCDALSRKTSFVRTLLNAC